MTKLITILVVAIMATSVTFAQSSTHNESETASATFTTTVIQALEWNDPTSVVLPKVIKGDIRVFSDEGVSDQAITFTLTGKADYDVTVTTEGPGPSGGTGAVNGVLLIGSWDNSTDLYTLDASDGTADFTYTCEGIDASDASVSTGDAVFTVGVSAEYSGL